MRIDKFLKVSRLIKRREVAKGLCENQNVTINGKIAKPMSEVNNGDTLVINIGRHTLTVEVLEVRQFANKEQSREMYRLINDEIKERESHVNA